MTARSLTLLSTIPAEGPDDFQLLVHDPSPEAENRSGERFDELRGRLRALDQHEKVVVALRYGFNGKPPKSNREIAAMLNMHRETVRLILTRAEKKLRSRRAATPDWNSRKGASSESENRRCS